MSLSEHEKRVLAEIEDALENDRPSFVETLRSRGGRRPRRGLVGLGALTCIAGLGAVLLGLTRADYPGTAVAVAGFAVTVIGCHMAVRTLSGRLAAHRSTPQARTGVRREAD